MLSIDFFTSPRNAPRKTGSWDLGLGRGTYTNIVATCALQVLMCFPHQSLAFLPLRVYPHKPHRLGYGRHGILGWIGNYRAREF